MHLLLPLLLVSSFAHRTDDSHHTVEPYEFKTRSGDSVPAELHALSVPAVRGDEAAGPLTLRWIRLPATEAGKRAPIVYLAGGPGGSGIDAGRGPRWALFSALQTRGDVILLDQRGTGKSRVHQRFMASVGFGPDTPSDRESVIAIHRKGLEEALVEWRKQGIPLRAYTTAESARDLDEIRKALGVEKVDLLGISYGTHLALAAMRECPDAIGRVVLASVEGPDDTVKLPSRTDAYFARLQAAVDADTSAKELYPDLRGLIRRVLKKLESEPQRIEVHGWRGKEVRTFGRFAAQRAISYSIADPEDAVELLAGLKGADEDDDFSWLSKWGILLGARVSFDPMSTMMDLASGISARRAELVEEERATALLDDATNFPMPHLRALASDFGLPKAFRQHVISGHPTLILSGTLDGRTYPSAAREVAEHLEKSTFVAIENAGHNLFFADPSIVPMIVKFFDGSAPQDGTIVTAPAPDFSPR